MTATMIACSGCGHAYDDSGPNRWACYYCVWGISRTAYTLSVTRVTEQRRRTPKPKLPRKPHSEWWNR